MNLGSKLTALRNKKYLTQDQMAELLDVKRARYNAWENEISKPDLEMIKKIAEFHKVSIDSLVGTKLGTENVHWADTNLLDFKSFMKHGALIMFDGEPMSEEDKQRIMGFVESIFWDVKKKK